jgi:hypothetical protein
MPQFPTAPRFAAAPPAGDGSYQRTRELLAGYGLSFPEARFVTDAGSAAAAAICLAGAEHPEYSEVEVNPVLAYPGGAIALDAHGVLARA